MAAHTCDLGVLRLQRAFMRRQARGEHFPARSLRPLADKMEGWRNDNRSAQREKDERLLGMLV